MKSKKIQKQNAETQDPSMPSPRAARLATAFGALVALAGGGYWVYKEQTKPRHQPFSAQAMANFIRTDSKYPNETVDALRQNGAPEKLATVFTSEYYKVYGGSTKETRLLIVQNGLDGDPKTKSLQACIYPRMPNSPDFRNSSTIALLSGGKVSSAFEEPFREAGGYMRDQKPKENFTACSNVKDYNKFKFVMEDGVVTQQEMSASQPKKVGQNSMNKSPKA